MRLNVVTLLAGQFLKGSFRNKAVGMLAAALTFLLIFAAISGRKLFIEQHESRTSFQKEVREKWESMPDKHPHRMAHYGYIAFRTSHPLRFFDFGLESFTGNAVFLEAHKQNTVNFSEASFSTGLLRFGEISMAMILQLLFPLVIFFIGFHAIAGDRENGTLKLLFGQGISWQELIIGRSLGLFAVAMILFLPAVILLIYGWLSLSNLSTESTGPRVFAIMATYTIYFLVCSLVTVIVSALCKSSKLALTSLIGIWLMFMIIIPRTTQALGNQLFPSPSKIQFESAVEKELIKRGDSHDPNDPYYKKLKDSVLKANGVTSVEELPFNYSGFQMKEGEKISSEIYDQHQKQLLALYRKQNQVARIAAFIDPYLAVRHFSMAICGTNFSSYSSFMDQTEAYRYELAQHMNDLQIKLISNHKPGPGEKPHSISSNHWKAFNDFHYSPLALSSQLSLERSSAMALFAWLILLLLIIRLLSKTLNVV